jgi:hypothetical protein
MNYCIGELTRKVCDTIPGLSNNDDLLFPFFQGFAVYTNTNNAYQTSKDYFFNVYKEIDLKRVSTFIQLRIDTITPLILTNYKNI